MDRDTVKEKKREIFEATRNVIPGEYDTIDLFYKWHIAELEKAEEKTVNELHNLHDIVLKEDVRIAKRDARVEVANILGNCLGATNLKDDYNQGWDTAVNNIKLMADKIIINNKEATNALPDK